MATVAGGIAYFPVDGWVRGFLALGMPLPNARRVTRGRRPVTAITPPERLKAASRTNRETAFDLERMTGFEPATLTLAR
ncbi:hypothetical protein [Amycolatopsis lexingtonensis]|uniref:hypothetical protein n=1 Tax=Amycolatopsis lexingtonensis TaxID=218822 RepID=UPI003F707B14